MVSTSKRARRWCEERTRSGVVPKGGVRAGVDACK